MTKNLKKKVLMIKGNKLSCEEEYFKSLSLYSLFRLQTILALEPPLLLNAGPLAPMLLA